METKFKIIETENYLIATSTKDFETNYYYNEFDKALRIGTVRQPYHKSVVGYYSKDNSIELDLPLLPEIVVEDNVEKLAESYYTQIRLAERTAFKFGYKSATKVYSEEDLRKVIKMAWEADSIDGTVDLNIVLHYGRNNDLRTKWSEDELIQSLKQPKAHEWFVVKMEQVILKDPNLCEHYIEVGCIEDICTCYTFRLKTTTINNKTYLAGHYEY
jgi:hypothetical protein